MRLAGVSRRQIQWWRDHGLLQPAIIMGNTAAYDQPDALRALLMAELLRRKVSFSRARSFLGNVPASGLLLILDGKLITVQDRAEAIAVIAKWRGALLIDIDELVERLFDAPAGTRVHLERDTRIEAWMR